METIQDRFLSNLVAVAASREMYCSVHYSFANMGTIFIHRDQDTCDVLEHVRFEFSGVDVSFKLGLAEYQIAYVSGRGTVSADHFWRALADRLDHLQQ